MKKIEMFNYKKYCLGIDAIQHENFTFYDLDMEEPQID
jgi:hypothetical protein